MIAPAATTMAAWAGDAPDAAALVGVAFTGADLRRLTQRRCPLTGVVENPEAVHRSVSDMFRPGWFARRPHPSAEHH